MKLSGKLNIIWSIWKVFISSEKIFNHPERSKSVQTVMKVLGQFNSFFFLFYAKKTFRVCTCYPATHVFVRLLALALKLSQRIKWMAITFTFYLLIEFQTLPGLRSRPWVPLVTILRGDLKKNIVFRSFSIFVVVRLIYFK